MADRLLSDEEILKLWARNGYNSVVPLPALARELLRLQERVVELEARALTRS